MTKEAFEDFKGEGKGAAKNAPPKPSYEELYKEHVEAIADNKDAEYDWKCTTTLKSFMFTFVVYSAFMFIEYIAVIGGNEICIGMGWTSSTLAGAWLALAFTLCVILIQGFIWWHFAYVALTVWNKELKESYQKLMVYVKAGRTALREYNKNKRSEEDL